MRAAVTGLIAGAVTLAVVALADRTQKPARKNADGWKMLRPGWLVNMLIVALAVLWALASYFALAGSSRPTVATEAAAAAILMLGSGSALIYYLWIGYGRNILWKGTELRVRTCFGRERVRRIRDVSAVVKVDALGDYKITFKDGSTLWLSPHFHGSRELMKRLPKWARA